MTSHAGEFVTSEITTDLSSSGLALVGEFPPERVSGFKDLKDLVDQRYEELGRGSQNQYVSVKNIPKKMFESIEHRRVELGRRVTFTYFEDIETLIIKLPSKAHEKAHRSLGSYISRSVYQMNIPIDEFCPIGATLYTGYSATKKEPDSSWMNLRIRSSPADWPSLVIEAGLSQSLSRLRTAASWWIDQSVGQVNIVLVVWIRPGIRTVKIEKWVLGPTRCTRSTNRTLPIKVSEITINQSATPPTIDGAPLRLEFDKVFGRAPVPPVESDILLTRQDLDSWANTLWIGL